MRPPAGSTLVEIVVALTLLGIALPPLGIALMVARREAWRGEARSRAAVATLNLAAELGGSTTSCPGIGGTRQEGPVTLAWEAAGTGSVRTVRVRATAPAGARRVVDSVEFMIRCDP